MNEIRSVVSIAWLYHGAKIMPIYATLGYDRQLFIAKEDYVSSAYRIPYNSEHVRIIRPKLRGSKANKPNHHPNQYLCCYNLDTLALYDNKTVDLCKQIASYELRKLPGVIMISGVYHDDKPVWLHKAVADSAIVDAISASFLPSGPITTAMWYTSSYDHAYNVSWLAHYDSAGWYRGMRRSYTPPVFERE